MFTELPPDRYAAVRALFEPLAFNVEVLSILDGNTRGQVFVDDPDSPRHALAWDELATLFIAGPPEKEIGATDPTAPWVTFADATRLWTADTVIPQAQRWGIPDLTLFYDPPAWQARLATLFSTYRIGPGRRYHYTHTGVRQPPATLPEGYALRPIDAELLSRDDVPGLDWLGGWILSFWPTPEAFVERGLGYVVVSREGAIVSLCISVFVSGAAYEFGTATGDAHRNLGLSTAVTRACVNACLDLARTPVWHCWTDNAPSVAVAHKTGFELQREYEVLRLWVPQPQGSQ